MHNVEEVTSEEEKRHALAHLEGATATPPPAPVCECWSSTLSVSVNSTPTNEFLCEQ